MPGTAPPGKPLAQTCAFPAPAFGRRLSKARGRVQGAWLRRVSCRARGAPPGARLSPESAAFPAPCEHNSITQLVAETAFLHQHASHELHLCTSRPLIVKMRVDKGDTLESLSKACGLPVETLVAANGGAPCGCVCQHSARHHSSLRACPLTPLRPNSGGDAQASGACAKATSCALPCRCRATGRACCSF